MSFNRQSLEKKNLLSNNYQQSRFLGVQRPRSIIRDHSLIKRQSTNNNNNSFLKTSVLDAIKQSPSYGKSSQFSPINRKIRTDPQEITKQTCIPYINFAIEKKNSAKSNFSELVLSQQNSAKPQNVKAIKQTPVDFLKMGSKKSFGETTDQSTNRVTPTTIDQSGSEGSQGYQNFNRIVPKDISRYPSFPILVQPIPVRMTRQNSDLHKIQQTNMTETDQFHQIQAQAQDYKQEDDYQEYLKFKQMKKSQNQGREDPPDAIQSLISQTPQTVRQPMTFTSTFLDLPPALEEPSEEQNDYVIPKKRPLTGMKRGRKEASDSQYQKECVDKIEKWELDLKKPGITQKERNTIKNRISAQRSRLIKRQQTKNLQETISTENEGFNVVFKKIRSWLEANMENCPLKENFKCADQILERLLDELEDVSDEEMDSMREAPEGIKHFKTNNEGRQMKMLQNDSIGSTPGFKMSKFATVNNNENQRDNLLKLMQKFMNN